MVDIMLKEELKRGSTLEDYFVDEEEIKELRTKSVDPLTEVEKYAVEKLKALEFDFDPPTHYEMHQRIEWKANYFRHKEYVDDLGIHLLEAILYDQILDKNDPCKRRPDAVSVMQHHPPSKVAEDLEEVVEEDNDEVADDLEEVVELDEDVTVNSYLVRNIDERAHMKYGVGKQQRWETYIAHSLMKQPDTHSVTFIRQNTGFQYEPVKQQMDKEEEIIREWCDKAEAGKLEEGAHWIGLDMDPDDKHVKASMARKIPLLPDGKIAKVAETEKDIHLPLWKSVRLENSGAELYKVLMGKSGGNEKTEA